MKKFLIRILLLFLILISIDFITGMFGDFLYSHARGGLTKQTNDFLLHDEYNVIILGSSRAKHHYDTPYLRDSLNIDCFNAGYDGNGVILAYGLLSLVLERYNPKLVIYDVTSSFDIIVNPEDNENVRYINIIKPYWNHALIKKIIRDVSFKEWVKVHSGLIRFNSKYITIVKDFIITDNSFNYGFKPMYGHLTSANVITDTIACEKVDSLKLKYMEQMILLAKTNEVPIVFVKSPRFGEKNSDIINPAKEICLRNDIPFLDFRSDTLFQHENYFSDCSHLNSLGARCYTKKVFTEKIIAKLIKLN